MLDMRTFQLEVKLKDSFTVIYVWAFVFVLDENMQFLLL